MTFGEYYRQSFRTDIQRFMMSIPADSRNHDYDKTVFTIQYEKLGKDTPHLDVVPLKHRSHFAVALFFTVLVDEVFYTYYRSQYGEFRSLTMYPKFIGNCPGGCNHHFHPRDIFEAINCSSDGQNTYRRPDVSVYESFDQAIEVIKGEVFDFFSKYMTTINPSNFWQKCVNEFPFNKNNV